MSSFGKAVLRVVALSALMLTAIGLMRPAETHAFSCVGNCSLQKTACINACNGDSVCVSDCVAAYQICVNCCSGC